VSRSRSLIAALAIATGLAVMPVLPASAAVTHWVSENENNPVPPGKNCGRAGYTSIQAAVTAAGPGDTVMVCAGEYDEQVVINSKDITLTGQGDGTILRPSSPATLTSFYAYPPSCFWTGRRVWPVILVEDSAATTVTNLRIDGINLITAGSGAEPDRISGVAFAESGGAITDLTIDDIKSANYAQRTYVIDVSACDTPRSVDVTNNEVEDFSRAAIQAQGDDLTATVNDNKITGPGAIGPVNVPNGIVFIGDATGIADSNYLTKMHHVGSPAKSAGLLAFAADDLAGITFSNNEAHDVDDGVILASFSKNVIVGPGNYLHQNEKGIQIENNADLNQILFNRIHLNSIVGIQVHGPLAVPPGSPSGPNNVAHCNSIWQNTDGVINYNTHVFNAENNWWGHPTGPSGAGPGKGDTVSPNVDFTPWLDDPPHSGDCT
jgi:hypothetical protein